MSAINLRYNVIPNVINRMGVIETSRQSGTISQTHLNHCSRLISVYIQLLVGTVNKIKQFSIDL